MARVTAVARVQACVLAAVRLQVVSLKPGRMTVSDELSLLILLLRRAEGGVYESVDHAGTREDAAEDGAQLGQEVGQTLARLGELHHDWRQV